jgi:hypothetical protein
MEFDPQQTLVNIREAETADLLDRITAYRAGMEPDALDMIEQELRRRGVTESEVQAHQARCQNDCVFGTDGIALMCSDCGQPAAKMGWRWYRLFGLLPLLPLKVRFCKEHQPRSQRLG